MMTFVASVTVAPDGNVGDVGLVSYEVFKDIFDMLSEWW